MKWIVQISTLGQWNQAYGPFLSEEDANSWIDKNCQDITEDRIAIRKLTVHRIS